MTTIYLCGPINGCTDAEANEIAARPIRRKSFKFMAVNGLRN